MNKPIANLMQCLGVLLIGVLLLSAALRCPRLLGSACFYGLYCARGDAALARIDLCSRKCARNGYGRFASSQFIGVFVGGLMGGALLDTVGAIGVWAGMAALTLVWAVILGLSRLASPETATA